MKIAVFAIVALAGSVASAKVLDTSTSALSAGFGERAQGAWTTSFENFTPGVLDNQNGWPTSGTNLPWASVVTTNPQDGVQSVRIGADTTVAPGSQRLGFSPSVPTPANTADTTSWWFYVDQSDVGGADYDFIGQAPTQSLLTWRINLSFQGNIRILDDEGEGLLFVDSLTAFPVGSWFQLAVVTDPTANAGAGAIQYYLNGNLFYTSQTGTVAGTAVEQFVFRSDNFQNAGGFAQLDNIGGSIIPTPGAVALLGLGGLVASRRRRA
jgi:hypothetical protein